MAKKIKKYGKTLVLLGKNIYEPWVEEEKLEMLCEELFPKVAEDANHPLRGKTFREAIKEDVNDEMGWGKYKEALRKLGVEV